MHYRYKLGPLCFELRGNHAIAQVLAREFRSIAVAVGSEGADTSPAIVFDFVDKLPALRSYVRVGELKVSDEGYEARAGGLRYTVRTIDGVMYVDLVPEVSKIPFGELGRAVKRFDDWNYLTVEETIAKNFMYNVFDYLSQLALLERGACYLHASSFEKADRGVAIVAWGGIGKTTSMLKLVLEDGWRFLSDDLGLIDQDGVLWRTPKSLQVYAYNIAGQPKLGEALLGGRSRVDMASWKFRKLRRGDKGVRRRVSAEELLGQAGVGKSAALRDVIFIERVAVPDFQIEKMELEILARRASMILLNELQPFTDLSVAMHSSSRVSVLPSVNGFLAKSEETLRRSFADQQPWLLQIPLAAGPDELADVLRAHLS